MEAVPDAFGENDVPVNAGVGAERRQGSGAATVTTGGVTGVASSVPEIRQVTRKYSAVNIPVAPM